MKCLLSEAGDPKCKVYGASCGTCGKVYCWWCRGTHRCCEIDIVFDGPPGPDGPRFVEVEDENGASINFGEWIKRDDGYWVLRIKRRPLTDDEWKILKADRRALEKP